jgi:hypothetical protein
MEKYAIKSLDNDRKGEEKANGEWQVSHAGVVEQLDECHFQRKRPCRKEIDN